MTKLEMYEAIEKAKEELEGEYNFIGIRFEDKERQVGEIIEDYSRHNDEREDEREFPDYGTEEYEEMEEFDGVSAWDVVASDEQYSYRKEQADEPAKRGYITNHCYLIASKHVMGDPESILDHNEIVMIDAKVIAQLF
ncbi:hypothetical protein JCM19037_520 [Geomicrobium sp. JCM 19037]|uniref:hypothetical protein n=1 Tax=Geomicrobium sp. JCM 19037 TaxID=1460634 RepID=UPI00045F3DF4|nr:hypothetical protein [Geomicrobium sp. JCM 19037]GAK02294.1 hypothetical protein JCM19037_520 [Geomicrobium sp. JCM 19037]